MSTINTINPHHLLPHRIPAPYQAYPMTQTPRRMLPTGDCGFVVYPLPPFVFNATQSVRCQCRSYWPNPHTPDLCACGHHACYHSITPQQTTATSPPPAPAPAPAPPASAPPAPSSPSSVLTMGALANLMTRIARLEQELETQREREAKRELQLRSQPQPGSGIKDFVDELMERMDEAEERLSSVEKGGVDFEGRLDDLELRADEVEEEVAVLVREDEDAEEEEAAAKSANAETETGSGRNAVKTEPVTAAMATGERMAEKVANDTTAKGAAITTACNIVAQPSLKRRSSDSNLLLLERSNHPAAKRIRCQSSGDSGSLSA